MSKTNLSLKSAGNNIDFSIGKSHNDSSQNGEIITLLKTLIRTTEESKNVDVYLDSKKVSKSLSNSMKNTRRVGA